MTAPQNDAVRLQQVLGGLLRSGVIIAACVVAAGGAMYLARHGGGPPDYHTFHGEPQGLETLGGVAKGVLQGQATAVIQMGLLLLIATPVVRVAFSAYAFAREGDWKFVTITLIVLALLLFSLFGT